MATKYVARLLTFLTLTASGALGIFGFAAIAGPGAIFQQMVGVCMWVVASVLLVAALLCVRIRQAEDARQVQQETADEDYFATLLETLQEIRDRGYDTVDRLDTLLREKSSL